MKTQIINSQSAFGKNTGGVKCLKITAQNGGIRFTEVAKESADVRVFVAGGPEIDKLVREANIKTLDKSASKPIITTRKTGILRFFKRLLNF